MRVAIVGGGAAGVSSAYLLSGHHAVTLFEAEEELGGNICTLNRNVRCDAGAERRFLVPPHMRKHESARPRYAPS